MRHTIPICSAALCLALPASPGFAATFSQIASVSGGPQIGAVSGTTLYGTSASGGTNGAGQLFSISTTGTNYQILHNFTASVDGSSPNARLALNRQGDLFGTATGGGTYGGGTLWRYSATGGMTTEHSFGSGSDGAVPMQGPSLGPHGVIYDTTGEGAIGGSGNIFSFHRKTYDPMYLFMSGTDGHCPFSGVAVTKAGVLYGTTVGVGFGGNPNGSVWQFTPPGTLKTLYVFQNGNDGEWPNQAPVVDRDGNVYGTTNKQNGNQFAGAIWKITAQGQFSVLHEMVSGTDGYDPNSPLVLGPDHLLYGTTANGGANGFGTVFSISTKGAFTVVHAFANTGDGAYPTGNLVQTSAGVMYGGTYYGSIFQITP
jgi:uncharacterized repeat protein (TIGR03803 family)